MSQNERNKAEGKEMLVRMKDSWRKKFGIGDGWQVVGSNWVEMYDLRLRNEGGKEILKLKSVIYFKVGQ